MTCASCGSGAFEQLTNFGSVPYSGTFLDAPDQTFHLRSLAFDFCVRCGFIRQRSLASVEVDYSDVARRTERQLPHYVGRILERLRGYADPSDLIIEVGANDGTFLGRLAQAGFKRRVAIEPSRPLARLCEEAGHDVENTHLDEFEAARISRARGPARVVVCRHTLEHVPDPGALLRAIRTLLTSDGIVFIEVPGTSPILTRLYGFELWDEHLSYFSPSNLATLLAGTGYRVLDQWVLPHLASENILCWAKPETGVSPRNTDAQSLLAQCRRFDSDWRTYAEGLVERSVRWPHPVVAMGASHLQSNFLLFTGLGASIDALFDDDPVKTDKWVPLPRAVPVHRGDAQGALIEKGTVLLTGFGYRSWMRRVREQLERKGVTIIDPLSELERFCAGEPVLR